ncbi:hypothetical protein [Azospirillum aestuarii]|nr:hypothetical protein [Azospirillum aestuarii]
MAALPCMFIFTASNEAPKVNMAGAVSWGDYPSTVTAAGFP